MSDYEDVLAAIKDNEEKERLRDLEVEIENQKVIKKINPDNIYSNIIEEMKEVLDSSWKCLMYPRRMPSIQTSHKAYSSEDEDMRKTTFERLGISEKFLYSPLLDDVFRIVGKKLEDEGFFVEYGDSNVFLKVGVFPKSENLFKKIIKLLKRIN